MLECSVSHSVTATEESDSNYTEMLRSQASPTMIKGHQAGGEMTSRQYASQRICAIPRRGRLVQRNELLRANPRTYDRRACKQGQYAETLCKGINMSNSRYFTELTRVQIPAILHLTRIGYQYFGKISEDMAGTVFDPDTNILLEVFRVSH